VYVMLTNQYRGFGASGDQYLQAGGAALLSASKFTGPAAPFVAVAGIAIELLAAIGVGKGCGNTCITASKYADKAEALLKQNLDTYKALATPRSKSAQTAALLIFDQVWSGLQTSCATVGGTAGTNCIADRQAGACKWTNAAGCFNWFVGYRDPIANDPNVVDDSATSTVSGAVSSSVDVGGTSISVWALLAAGVALYFVFRS
jgi:hypothetical protein